MDGKDREDVAKSPEDRQAPTPDVHLISPSGSHRAFNLALFKQFMGKVVFFLYLPYCVEYTHSIFE